MVGLFYKKGKEKDVRQSVTPIAHGLLVVELKINVIFKNYTVIFESNYTSNRQRELTDNMLVKHLCTFWQRTPHTATITKLKGFIIQ